jgi:hypothetical protein
MKSLMQLSLVISVLVFLLPSTSFSGWFGPSNKDECVKKYEGDAQSPDTYNTMLIGCQLWFEHNKQKFGKCMLDHFEDVRSDEGSSYLSAACDLLSQSQHVKYHDGAKCMLGYVSKVTNEESKLFFSNLKCKVPLKIETTTTHQDGSTTTTIKEYKY